MELRLSPVTPRDDDVHRRRDGVLGRARRARLAPRLPRLPPRRSRPHRAGQRLRGHRSGGRRLHRSRRAARRGGAGRANAYIPAIVLDLDVSWQSRWVKARARRRPAESLARGARRGPRPRRGARRGPRAFASRASWPTKHKSPGSPTAGPPCAAMKAASGSDVIRTRAAVVACARATRARLAPRSSTAEAPARSPFLRPRGHAHRGDRGVGLPRQPPLRRLPPTSALRPAASLRAASRAAARRADRDVPRRRVRRVRAARGRESLCPIPGPAGRAAACSRWKAQAKCRHRSSSASRRPRRRSVAGRPRLLPPRKGRGARRNTSRSIFSWPRRPRRGAGADVPGAGASAFSVETPSLLLTSVAPSVRGVVLRGAAGVPRRSERRSTCASSARASTTRLSRATTCSSSADGTGFVDRRRSPNLPAPDTVALVAQAMHADDRRRKLARLLAEEGDRVLLARRAAAHRPRRTCRTWPRASRPRRA